MQTKTRLQIIRDIKAKARLAAQLTRHDPEPGIPDVMQTVGIKAFNYRADQ